MIRIIRIFRMIKIFRILILLGIAIPPVLGQDYMPYRKAMQTLRSFSVSDSSLLQPQINSWWEERKRLKQIPLIADDSVAFLYRGPATSVEWMGDFNSWGYKTEFKNKGRRIRNTDIWVLTSSFPKQARLDYKIVVNGMQWILDPENQHQQWSGVGGGSPNSELRMPDWKEDPIVSARADIAHGTIIKDQIITSNILGYQVSYSVYVPPGIPATTKLPVLYVTDGYEYMMPELGNMPTVIDNLIADKKIQPILAVFVDHREPINRANNKRMKELNMNAAYLDFFVKELIPAIEAKYPTRRESSSRGILGTSMGGLAAAYFSFSHPEVFGLAGIQSPAFWLRPEIYSICDSLRGPKVRVFLTTGLIHDAGEGSQKMKDILQKNACPYQYRETQEGHSWGNWRNLIDDILIDFYGKR